MKTAAILVALLVADPVVTGSSAPVAVNGVIYGQPSPLLDLLRKRTGARGKSALLAYAADEAA
jgi:hypothetical protein